jgi:hypothetical protein
VLQRSVIQEFVHRWTTNLVAESDSLGDRILADNKLYLSQQRGRETVSDPVVETLILDLLQWLTNGERTYEEVMDAWRTSCPRLTVWEESNDRGLIASEYINGRNFIRASSLGRTVLERCRPQVTR